MDALHTPDALPSVYLLVDGRLRCQAARGYFQVVDGFPPGAGVLGRVVAGGVGELIQDVTAHPEFIAAVPGLQAEVCEPVSVGGESVGAVNVESRCRLDRSIAARVATAAARLGRRIDALGGLPPDSLPQRAARVAVALTALTDVGQIRAHAMVGAIALSGMASASISERDGAGRWSVAAARGPLERELRSWTHDDHQVIARWVGAGMSSHFYGGEDCPPEYEFLRRDGIRGIAVQPLVVAGTVTGLLTTADTCQLPHEATVTAAMELLAAQVAATLATARTMAELARLVRLDPLTGLANAATFAADLRDAAVAAARGGQAATACVLLDIDHFKVVNDTLGHPVGDEVLRRLATALLGALRAGDRLYRVGGDEFAALITARTTEELAAAMDRLVGAARAVGTTVSAGGAPLGDSGESVRVVADRALYRAKSLGRDRWYVADTVPAVRR